MLKKNVDGLLDVIQEDINTMKGEIITIKKNNNGIKK